MIASPLIRYIADMWRGDHVRYHGDHVRYVAARRSCPLCPPRPADSYHSGSRSAGAEPRHAGRTLESAQLHACARASAATRNQQPRATCTERRHTCRVLQGLQVDASHRSHGSVGVHGAIAFGLDDPISSRRRGRGRGRSIFATRTSSSAALDLAHHGHHHLPMQTRTLALQSMVTASSDAPKPARAPLESTRVQCMLTCR